MPAISRRLLKLRARAECTVDCAYVGTLLVPVRDYIRRFSYDNDGNGPQMDIYFACTSDELSNMIESVIRFLFRLARLGHDTHRLADTINFEDEFTGEILHDIWLGNPYVSLISRLESKCEPW
jgi:hypothetical protein